MLLCQCALSASASDGIRFAAIGEYTRHSYAVDEEAGMWCTDPEDSHRILGASEAPGGDAAPNIFEQHVSARLSNDSGRNWKELFQTDASQMEFDPVCAFGRKGLAFIGAMAAGTVDGRDTGFRGYHLWRSTDGGQTWNLRPTYINYPRALDRAFIAVDHSTAPWAGRVYVVGAAMNIGKNVGPDMTIPQDTPPEIRSFVSDDAGLSFRAGAVVPVAQRSDSARVAVNMGQIAILDDGELLASWTEAYRGTDGWNCKSSEEDSATEKRCGTSAIKVAVSRDGGITFGEPVLVARGKYDLQLDHTRKLVGKWYPALAVDPASDTFPGAVYLAWSDTAAGRQEILFTASKDHGITWTNPLVVSDDRAVHPDRVIDGPHNAMVTLAVIHSGVVGMMYYAQVNDATAEEFQPVFTSSSDAGVTWSAVKPVSANTLAVRRQAPAWNIGRAAALYTPFEGNFLLHFPNYSVSVPTCNYGLIAGPGDAFRLVTVANPFGPIVYSVTEATDVSQPTHRRPVNEQVTLSMRGYSYDPARGLVNAEIAIRNVSDTGIVLPLRVAVKGIGPGRRNDGSLEVLNADNARKYTGAWWDIYGPPGGTLLPPGAETTTRVLKFRATSKGAVASQPSAGVGPDITLILEVLGSQ